MVLVSLCVNDGRYFTIRLSRVPCVGEEVIVEGDEFLINKVQHDSLDEDGRAAVGYHAYLDVVASSSGDKNELPPTQARRKSKKSVERST
jgi:hypothetical protein